MDVEVMPMRAFLVCLCSAASVLAAGPLAAQSGDTSANAWGGDHVRMELTKTGAKLDFDCASGTIDQPLTIPEDGKFQAHGTFIPERPGPVRKDGNPAAAATYVGTIKGDSMYLEIVLAASKETVGTYQLTRGSPGHVFKCR
jgi:hypothetical protein